MPSSLSFLFIASCLFFFVGCESSVVEQLRPETQAFLGQQEQARCTCLEIYGDKMLENINTGIEHIQNFAQQYDLQHLTPAQRHDIKLRLIPTTSMIKTVSACIAQRTPPIDQLTGLLIKEDLRVVLELDSTLTEQERLERMNQPSLEILDDLCPKYKQAVVRLQDLIREAQVLPAELQWCPYTYM